MASYNPAGLLEQFLTQEWDSFTGFIAEAMDLDWHLDREQIIEIAEDVASSI